MSEAIRAREGQSTDTERRFACTDFGNAERLVARYGSDLRYAPGLGWLTWDGRRWRLDRDGEVMRRAKLMVRSIYEEAARADHESERKTLAKWATTSESEPRVKAAVSMAQTELEVVVRPIDLDADPYLLNVENGTIDLRTSELREHRREDLLTKLAPVVYREDADKTEWVRFLARVTDADEELHAFLKRAVGYTLTGDTGEEVLFFAHGPAATGKTSFLEAVRATFGDYGATANFETFLARRGESGPRPDIARLAGARLVVGVEVDEGKRLAEGLVKQLTGGDTITARRLYSEDFEFRPQFKLWLAANARPRVNADDDAIWRRIVQAPFTVVIPEGERDPELKRRLREDPDMRSAILLWAVEGFREYERDGLNVPARVRDYTAEYRAENDPIAEWVDACCVLDPNATATVLELRGSYETWAQQNGERPISKRALGTALRAHGFTDVRVQRAGKAARAWKGIGIRHDAWDQPSPAERNGNGSEDAPREAGPQRRMADERNLYEQYAQALTEKGSP